MDFLGKIHDFEEEKSVEYISPRSSGLRFRPYWRPEYLDFHRQLKDFEEESSVEYISIRSCGLRFRPLWEARALG